MINQIHNMDCLEGMKLLQDKSVDMILCDLPYGVTAHAHQLKNGNKMNFRSNKLKNS